MKNINLKDFVKATLKDIIDGVHEVSKEVAEEKGLIAPAVRNAPVENLDYDIQDVEFDVAVTVTENVDSNIKAGIKMLGAGSEFSKENVYAQRIKFHVPIGLKKGKDRTLDEQNKQHEALKEPIAYQSNKNFWSN